MSSIEALGLYPENDFQQCSTVVSTVAGRVMDEIVNHSVQGITYAVILRVDESDFKRSRKWRVSGTAGMNSRSGAATA